MNTSKYQRGTSFLSSLIAFGITFTLLAVTINIINTTIINKQVVPKETIEKDYHASNPKNNIKGLIGQDTRLAGTEHSAPPAIGIRGLKGESID